MKGLLLTITLTISPILAQCDWNEDGSVDVIDVVDMVDCILYECWDGTQCDWNEDDSINIYDIVLIVECIFQDCWTSFTNGCIDPIANNFDQNAIYDDNSCEYFDINDNLFSSVIIGEQRWMAANLNVTHFQNGESIPNILSDNEWGDISSSAYCDYDNEPLNAEIYGRLYNWFAVSDEFEICPAGWSVPTNYEWQILKDYLGDNAGGKLKEAGFAHWNYPNVGATDEFDFIGLPGGLRGGDFLLSQDQGHFWTSSPLDDNNAFNRFLLYDSGQVHNYDNYQYVGLSIRCIRENFEGCTDSTAINYLPHAVYDDGNCEFSGCTDSIAINYIPEATIEDSSCVYYFNTITDFDGNNYNTVIIGDQGWMVDNL
jgi:uncharacterized protein (TIGR02145 family)